jgi:hypothetical protein
VYPGLSEGSLSEYSVTPRWDLQDRSESVKQSASDQMRKRPECTRASAAVRM